MSASGYCIAVAGGVDEVDAFAVVDTVDTLEADGTGRGRFMNEHVGLPVHILQTRVMQQPVLSYLWYVRHFRMSVLDL